jgi:hypothetical protein
MEAEHCARAGCTVPFTTSNYGITSTPQQEWRYVVDMQTDGADMRHGRRLLDVDSLAATPTAQAAKLTRVELIAVVLYTGPMVTGPPSPSPLFPHCPLYRPARGPHLPTQPGPILKKNRFTYPRRYTIVSSPAIASSALTRPAPPRPAPPQFAVYNAILRQWPAAMYETFRKGRNLYPTTIHVLVSAVQKLACALKLPEGLALYRGLGGTMRLPESFHRADASGCRGFAEWGFMSTTSSRGVALAYSGVDEHKPLPTVFEIRVGAVDRGACIRDFSQYPGEIE